MSDTPDSTNDAPEASSKGMSFATKVRYALYAALLVIGLSVLAWQWLDDNTEWIIGGLYKTSIEQLQDTSTPQAPIYWLGPDGIPGDEFITYTLSDKEKGLATKVRGAVLYLPPQHSKEAIAASGKPEPDITTFASVYTRPLDAGARQNLAKTERACDAGDCPLKGWRIQTRFGPAYVEPAATGGWIGRVAIDDHSLVIVTAGDDMKPVNTFNALRPIDDVPPPPKVAIASKSMALRGTVRTLPNGNVQLISGNTTYALVGDPIVSKKLQGASGRTARIAGSALGDDPATILVSSVTPE